MGLCLLRINKHRLVHVVARLRLAGVVGGEGLCDADAASLRRPARSAGALAAQGAHPPGGPARCGCKCSQGSPAGRGPPTEAGSGSGTGRAQAEDGRPDRSPRAQPEAAAPEAPRPQDVGQRAHRQQAAGVEDPSARSSLRAHVLRESSRPVQQHGPRPSDGDAHPGGQAASPA
eukprot:scaffold25499_cov63-Phaeocystis_antarctica.AAC.1